MRTTSTIINGAYEALPVRGVFTSAAGIFPAIMTALLPKCPLCLAAYAGVLGIFGFDPFIYRAWLVPVMIVFGVFTAIVLSVKSVRSKRYLPLAIGLAGIVLILVDKIFLETNVMIWPAAAAVIVSSVLLTNLKKDSEAAGRCDCPTA